jgi:hypothetical protein
MFVVPQAVRDGYGEFLIGKGITHQDKYTCQKWLRFYLDFCSKYQHDATSSGSLDYFLMKLTEKKQPHQQKKTHAKGSPFLPKLHGARLPRTRHRKPNRLEDCSHPERYSTHHYRENTRLLK